MSIVLREGEGWRAREEGERERVKEKENVDWLPVGAPTKT